MEGKNKEKKKRVIESLDIVIPAYILRDRTLSVLEALVEYLKEAGLTYHEISLLINRDERNIWTVYNRAKKKRGANESK